MYKPFTKRGGVDRVKFKTISKVLLKEVANIFK